jgi:hypothetical protein
VFSDVISDETPWNLRDAKFTYRKERKPEDPAELPDVGRPRRTTASRPGSMGTRVSHAKFGEGIVVDEEGDRLNVQFGNERRTLLRSFVKIVK